MAHVGMTNVLKRSGKLRMLLRDEFLTPLRYYKVRIDADPPASLERRHTVNEFGSNVERHHRELLIHCYRMAGSLPDAEDAVQVTLLRGLALWRQPEGRRAIASMALPRGYERLLRKYVCGVVPSIVRNISMKSLTLS